MVARQACALEAALDRDVHQRVQRDVALRAKVARAARKRARASSPPVAIARLVPSTSDRGSRNEQRAEQALVAKGLTIVARNYRCDLGELDLIVRDGSTIVFVEVRSRADDQHGHAAEMVGTRKQRQVSRVASFYLEAERPTYQRTRFDVVAITGAVLEHVEDAWRLTR
ncbi:MAG: YraN family protein [Proteobacteria bacterium]|nr:YraN family protein [Pseudomonadota bacterium]